MVNYDKMDRNQVREREFQVLDSGMAPALGKLSWWEEKSVKETMLCGAQNNSPQRCPHPNPLEPVNT